MKYYRTLKILYMYDIYNIQIVAFVCAECVTCTIILYSSGFTSEVLGGIGVP